jgi:hypothetical protein
MKIIVLRRLLDTFWQIVPSMYTNVDPHNSQPEKAGNDAKLNKVTWKKKVVLLMSRGEIRFLCEMFE